MLLAACCSAAPVTGKEPAFRGMRVAAALQLLQARGLPVFFSSGLVRGSMRVESEPMGASPREILDAILSPHGLRAEEVEGRLVVVAGPPASSSGSEAAPVRPPRRSPDPDPIPTVRDEIVVTTGRSELGREAMEGSFSLDAEAAGELPLLGDDPLRAISLLPGATAPEASSRLHIRGGRDDEVLVVLDGLELLAPYHLQEFDSALSIVAPGLLDRAELSTGGYPAEYGDRMSGVLNLSTLNPSHAHRFEIGLGLLYGEAAASGGLRGDRGRWYGAARSGNYHLALEVNDRDENPHYWDVFGKLASDLRPGQTLQLNVLVAEDDFDLSSQDRFGQEDSPGGGELYRSRWQNRYLWLTHGALVGPDVFVESIASAGRIGRSRSGSSAATEVRDFRLLDFAGLKNIWSFQPTERSLLEGGVELRRFHSDIDYSNHQATRFTGLFDYDQTGAFITSRLRPFAHLTAEIGARYDHDTFTAESHVSPRLNLAWEPREGNVFRLAWGWFHQSQRPNELQVEDGETELARAERAEHRILGYEHRRESGATFRLEAYERRLSRSRVRFENLFDPIVLFPEVTTDRVRIAPEDGRAQGIDLLLRSPERRPLRWWLTYSFSSVKDDLGGSWVPRGFDQPHALRADVNYQTARGWNWNAAWLYHTGWPTTRVSGQVVSDPGGSTHIEPVLGPFNGERLPDYHRLDLRLSRAWTLKLGRLDTYLDLQNLYDRQNVRGFEDFGFERGTDGEVRVDSRKLSWGGFLPSFGIRWQI